MLYGLAIFIFVTVCIMLMGIILLQSSKTGGMGTAMGGGAINTAFGGQGADKLLVKITSVLAVFFMILAKPGFWLQNITTKQPDDDQVEVALKALEEAFGDKLSHYTKGETYVAEAI